MKILIVNHHPQDVLSGSEIQCDLIATYLTRFGHDVVYLALNGKQKTYQCAYPVSLGAPGFQGIRGALKQHQPDIVYWRFNRRKLFMSILACTLCRTPVVYAISSLTDLVKWAHRVNFRELSLKKRLQTIGSYHFLRHVAAMRLNYFGFYLVDGVVAQLKQQTSTLPVRHEVIVHNSVNSVTTSFSWPRPFVIWVGNLKAVKNPEMYLELAQRCEHLPVDFLMVGAVRGRYQHLFAPEFLPSNFYCLGAKPHAEVNAMLQRALFLVQTSYIEGFPNVLIQAWMQARATLSLSYDPDGIIQTQGLGLVSGSVQQLVKDTERLVNNTTEREEMGQRARQFAVTHFAPEQNIRQLETFLQDIVTRKRV